MERAAHIVIQETRNVCCKAAMGNGVNTTRRGDRLQFVQLRGTDGGGGVDGGAHLQLAVNLYSHEGVFDAWTCRQRYLWLKLMTCVSHGMLDRCAAFRSK